MDSQSRTAKSIKNSIVALIMYTLNLVLQFFSRKIFLDYLGTEILGLNTTATNILQFLNLAELGISSAVAFSLYKPLYDNDKETINEIVSLQGHIYRRIAFIIIGGAAVIMCFFPLIFRKMELPIWYAYMSFGVLLLSSLLGYFVNYKQVVLSANQQEYKIIYSFKFIMLLKVMFQMLAVWKLENGYVWWAVLEAVFAIIGAVVLHIVTMRNFPFLQTAVLPFRELRTKYHEIETKIKQLFFHKISNFVLFQSSPIIIYGLSSLTLVSLYGNYLLIIQGLISLLAASFNGMVSGIGNLIASSKIDHIIDVFYQLYSLRFYIISVIAYSTWLLADDFVIFWIGEEYILPKSTLLIMIVTFMVYTNRYIIYDYISAYGFFGDIWAAIIEVLLNIGLSILLGIFYNLNGVLLGVLISSIIISVIWKPIYLFNIKLKINISFYKRTMFILLVCIFALIIVDFSLKNIIKDPFTLTDKIVLIVSYSIICGIILYIFFKPFRSVMKRFI